MSIQLTGRMYPPNTRFTGYSLPRIAFYPTEGRLGTLAFVFLIEGRAGLVVIAGEYAEALTAAVMVYRQGEREVRAARRQARLAAN